MRLMAGAALRLAATGDHGVLATLRAGDGPDLVPACFAIDRNRLAIPVDRVKPKASIDLQRSRNLADDPRATFLVERWDPNDWSRLWWVRLRLEQSTEPGDSRARLEGLLRDRYVQYRDAPFAAVLTFRIVEVSGWSADPSVADGEGESTGRPPS